MIISINYHSIWKNSFLTGSNDEPVGRKKNAREFKASSKSDEPVDVRVITKNTVLGILCRLVGDQRKLYQAKASEEFYFKDMLNNIEFTNSESEMTGCEETAYIINKNLSAGRPAKDSFLGVLPDYCSLFDSKYSATLWSLLDYSIDEIIDFIINPELNIIDRNANPTHILNRVVHEIAPMNPLGFIEDKINLIKTKLSKEMAKEKPRGKQVNKLQGEIEELEHEAIDPKNTEFEKKLRDAVLILEKRFDGNKYINNRKVYVLSLYAGALYLMIDMLLTNGKDVSDLLNKNGLIQGFSKAGFNGVRDFLNPLTGGGKKTTHTPCAVSKASGQLEIKLDIDIDKAVELKRLIDNAGVSAFYLGKKGLAYVSHIDVR